MLTQWQKLEGSEGGGTQSYCDQQGMSHIVLVYVGNCSVRIDLTLILTGQMLVTIKRTFRLKLCDINSSLRLCTQILQCFLCICVEKTLTYFDVYNPQMKLCSCS